MARFLRRLQKHYDVKRNALGRRCPPHFIGIHSSADELEILENLNYINIDILDHKEKQVDYQECMSINTGDNNLIRKIRFKNIRVENFRRGTIDHCRI